MYRLTLFQTPKCYLPSSLPASSVCRTYRWGNMWGIFQNGVWRVEKRKQILTEPYLLEEITQCTNIQAPPPVVDDVWDEEIIVVNDMEYNGMMVSVVLPGAILKKWCSKHELAIPDITEEKLPIVSVPISTKSFQDKSHTNLSFPKHQSSKHPNFKQSFQKQPVQRKCLILDE